MGDRRFKVSSMGLEVQEYCVFANHEFDMNTQGEYADEYPKGAVIHYTASRSRNGAIDARNTITYGKKMNHCYFCIDSVGTIYQTAPMSRWGWHAGSSCWPGLGGNLSSKLVGIELCCAGKLKLDNKGTYRSWFGETYGHHEVREVDKKDGYRHSGVYHQFTYYQIDSLTILLLWMKRNNPSVFDLNYVLGHDEVDLLSEYEDESDRKTDPGGSMHYPMSTYRKKLITLHNEIN